MRLSELIGSEVRDGNGVVIGTLRDVRLVQDGPDVDGFGRAFRIKGVLVGGHPWERLGMTRDDVKGPKIFKWWGKRVERDLRYLDWTQVRSFRPGTLEVGTSV
jgi:PRC-barrel domain